MAALERASQCGLAVFGGSQKVDYSLRADAVDPQRVVVTLQARRYGFRGFCAACAVDPKDCDIQSSIVKSAALAVSVDDVDVLDFVEEVDIMQNGQRLSPDQLRRFSVRSEVPRPLAFEEEQTGPLMRFGHDEYEGVALWSCEDCARSARGCLWWVCCCRDRGGEAREVQCIR